MKVVLCFGDSNTWGYNPRTKERYSKDERWTGVLKKELGQEYDVSFLMHLKWLPPVISMGFILSYLNIRNWGKELLPL